MNEIWKDIVGYEGFYQVSNLGRVRSLKCIKRTIFNNSGYEIVNLKVKRKQKNKLVHRLVAETFIPNPFNKEQVNHKDGNKKNNSVDNLEWCSRHENMVHAYKQGLRDKTNSIEAMKKASSNKIVVSNEFKTITFNCQNDLRKYFSKGSSWVSDKIRKYGNVFYYNGYRIEVYK